MQQTYQEKEIFFIDNNSRDHSVEVVKKHFPRLQCILNEKNIGYSRAANQSIYKAQGKYVMVMNIDIILNNDYIEKIVKYMEKEKNIAASSGKLLKYDTEKKQKTNIIDSTGLYCYRNRRIIDRGQGSEDKGQYDKEEEIFGITGACPIYRKSALESIKIENEYFDEDFFMYKEDIDISWRLRLKGWKIFYIPSAVAYHARGTGVLKRFTHIEVAKNRKHLSRFQKFYAYKNQRLMQTKNEMWQNILRDFPYILWKEILIFAYIILREPYLLRAFFHLLRQLPKAIRKRKYIMKNKVITWKDMSKWFQNNDPLNQ